jgi:hypothetical protein
LNQVSFKIGDFVQWEIGGQIQFSDPRRIREFSSDGQWAFVDGSPTGMKIEELTKMDATTIDHQQPLIPTLGTNGRVALQQSHTDGAKTPQMRSYSWALSGEFNAKMELFGEAETEEDIDDLKDYVDITIKALKRSLKSREASQN